MAKRTTKPPAPTAEEINESLVLLAETLLSDYFFDPDNEQDYKQKLSRRRSTDAAGVLLGEETIEVLDGDCDIRIEALRSWTQFRVTLSHTAFAATIEGTWSFEKEELSQVTVDRSGDARIIEAAVDMLMEEIEGSELDDEEFAGFLAGLDDEDEDEAPLIGDDPAEPPAATSIDRNRVKAIAKRIARNPDADVNLEDRAWLEQTPQVLPVVTELLIDLIGASKRDEKLIIAYHLLLSMQLEFVRYRQDRGWEWAGDMLATFQQRLIGLGADAAFPREEWFTMCSALTQARVPLSDEAQTALAEAGFKPDERDGPPEQMLRTLRGFMDELAKMVSSPFEVIHSLQNSGAMLPAQLRGFMAIEFALSPHQVLRDAVPLMLLDDDMAVRTSAVAALDQTAAPDSMSPGTLRRAITLRNWIPVATRPALDTTIRKARLAGVEIGPWPFSNPDLEFHASTIDGSGAQSILAVSRSGKKGMLGGVLLRHGVGVVDTWVDQDLTRAKISKLLRETQMSAPFVRVTRPFVDVLVQHAIGTSAEQDTAPPGMLLEVAELLGASEWKDRRLDIAAEAARMYDALDPKDRTPEGIAAGFARGLEWMTKDEVFGSWFEDGPQVQKTLGKLQRTDRGGMIALVMTDVLPAKRAAWAERFLMMALWCEAAVEPKHRDRAGDLVLVAHALTTNQPLNDIPIMAVIAAQTVRATLLGAW